MSDVAEDALEALEWLEGFPTAGNQMTGAFTAVGARMFDSALQKVRAGLGATQQDAISAAADQLCAGGDGSQPGPMAAYRQGVRDLAKALNAGGNHGR